MPGGRETFSQVARMRGVDKHFRLMPSLAESTTFKKVVASAKLSLELMGRERE